MRGPHAGVVILALLLAYSVFSHYRTGAKLTAVCEYLVEREEGRIERLPMLHLMEPGDRAALLNDLAAAERELQRQTGGKPDPQKVATNRVLRICESHLADPDTE